MPCDVGHFVKSWHGWTVPRSTSDDFASAEATGCKTQAFKESGDTFLTCSRSEYVQYLSRITREGEAKGHIRFFADSRVTSIRRASETSPSGCDSKKTVFPKQRDYFQVTVSDGRVFRATVVVAATGHFAVPRVLQVPGSTLPHVLTSKALGRQDLHTRNIVSGSRAARCHAVARLAAVYLHVGTEIQIQTCARLSSRAYT